MNTQMIINNYFEGDLQSSLLELENKIKFESLQEIRLRKDKPVVIKVNGENSFLKKMKN